MELAISITDKAKSRLRNLGAGGGRFLRVGVTTGGCSGMTYTATLETEMGEGDEEIFNDGEVRVVSDPRSTLFLDGLEIDYSDDLIQSGFRLKNGNASQSCGCGASFSVGA